MIDLPYQNNDTKQAPKLLSPIRSFEGAVRVIDAGADEIYCGIIIPGIDGFHLYRGSVSEVPTYVELGRIVKHAHNHGVKVYVTLNNPFMAEIIEKIMKNHIYSCIEREADAFPPSMGKRRTV